MVLGNEITGWACHFATISIPDWLSIYCAKRRVVSMPKRDASAHILTSLHRRMIHQNHLSAPVVSTSPFPGPECRSLQSGITWLKD